MKKLVLKHFQNVSSQADLWNYFYALTHVVIGESCYYRKRVDMDNWAFKILIRDFGNYYTQLSTDIVAEVGVCLRLSEFPIGETFSLIEHKILNSFNETAGIIDGKQDENYKLLEHRNILAAMALSSWRLNE